MLLCAFMQSSYAIRADQFAYAFNLRPLQVGIMTLPVHRIVLSAQLFAFAAHAGTFFTDGALTHVFIAMRMIQITSEYLKLFAVFACIRGFALRYSSLTLSFFVFFLFSLGKRTVRIPFLNVTEAASGSTSCGKMIERENLPQ